MSEPIPPEISNDSVKKPLISPAPESHLENPAGLYTQSYKLLFESPDQTQLELLGKIDSRITYFHYRIPDLPPYRLIPEDYPQGYRIPQELNVIFPIPDDQLGNAQDGQGIPRGLFNFHCVIPYLERYITEKYKDKEIAVRGTACTIRTEPCIIANKDISNPQKILQDGIEYEGDMAHMHIMTFDTNNLNFPSNSLQWLTQHPEAIRNAARKEGKKDLEKSIFPIVLIYDRTKFPKDSTDLPRDIAERSKCILEAIVLDYPLSKREFLQNSNH